MPNLPALNQLVNSYTEETLLWVEGLEALAPENFADNTSQSNFENYFSAILVSPEKEAAYRKFNFCKTRAVMLNSAESTGLCALFESYFGAVGCSGTSRKKAIRDLQVWWSVHYPHFSGCRIFPVKHPYAPANYAYEKFRRWETEQQYANDDAHLIYCARRYELAQCTAQCLRRILETK